MRTLPPILPLLALLGLPLHADAPEVEKALSTSSVYDIRASVSRVGSGDSFTIVARCTRKGLPLAGKFVVARIEKGRAEFAPSSNAGRSAEESGAFASNSTARLPASAARTDMNGEALFRLQTLGAGEAIDVRVAFLEPLSQRAEHQSLVRVDVLDSTRAWLTALGPAVVLLLLLSLLLPFPGWPKASPAMRRLLWPWAGMFRPCEPGANRIPLLVSTLSILAMLVLASFLPPGALLAIGALLLLLPVAARLPDDLLPWSLCLLLLVSTAFAMESSFLRSELSALSAGKLHFAAGLLALLAPSPLLLPLLILPVLLAGLSPWLLAWAVLPLAIPWIARRP